MRNKTLVIVLTIVVILCTIGIIYDISFSKKQKTIMLVGYEKYSTMWNNVYDGAQNAARQNGYLLESVACDSKNDVSKQKDLIQEAIKGEYDGLILVPTSVDMLSDSIDECRKRGIEVIIIDDIDEFRTYRYSALDYVDAAQTLKDIVKETKLDIMIVGDQRQNGFVKDMTNELINEYENSEIKIRIKDLRSDAKLVENTMDSVINLDKNIEYIISFGDEISIGTANSLAKYPNSDVKIISFAHDIAAMQKVDQGHIYKLFYKNYYLMGYSAVFSIFESGSDVNVGNLIIDKENILDDDIIKSIF